MGQYHKLVSITSQQFVHPHKLGAGLKLWEQIHSETIGAAILSLLACSNGRGGGDLEEDPIIGSWAGDRIALIGDYAEKGDIKGLDAALIYDLCSEPEKVADQLKYIREEIKKSPGDKVRLQKSLRHWTAISKMKLYTDISDRILPVVEKVMDVKISGTGWRNVNWTPGRKKWEFEDARSTIQTESEGQDVALKPPLWVPLGCYSVWARAVERASEGGKTPTYGACIPIFKNYCKREGKDPGLPR
jgi:hypothetical protein